MKVVLKQIAHVVWTFQQRIGYICQTYTEGKCRGIKEESDPPITGYGREDENEKGRRRKKKNNNNN